ncbi:MAG: DNRLRE domain-containing protein [Bacteroidota bacterium]
MKTYPTKVFNLSIVCIALFVIFSCNRDEDLFYEAVLEEPDILIEDDNSGTEDGDFEIRSFTFSPTNDVFRQRDEIHDQSIVRLEESNRTGYLMFDLSPIQEIAGIITDAEFEFTVYSDQGNGDIGFYLGTSNDWREEDNTVNNLPDASTQLNRINDSYQVGDTKQVNLQAVNLQPETISLVVVHENGNDLAFASKEHPSNNGPKLTVSYRVPKGTRSIEQGEEQEGNSGDSAGDTSSQGEEEDDIPTPPDTTMDDDVAYWKEQFDIAWREQYPKSVAQSESGNTRQEYYFMSYAIDGLTQIWQATGDTRYLDDALDLIENTIDDAVPVGGLNAGYLGWPSDLNRYGEKRNQEGTNLWESFLFRFVSSILRIMHQSPSLMAQGDYRQRYDAILQFTETQIWEKWYTSKSNLGNIYRSRSHMSSHWARIGMELYLITGRQQYLEVFENISYAGMPNFDGASLRARMFDNGGGAIAWYEAWDKDQIQDVNHGSDVVSFWVNAYENGMYWSMNDMLGLVATTKNVVWTRNNPIEFTVNVDGSGAANNRDAGSHGMIAVGRFDESLQARIRQYYNPKSVNYQESQAMGIAALNRKILNDGVPVYPENR